MIIGKIKPFILLFLLFSCQIKSGYEFSNSFGLDGWPSNSKLIFQIDSLEESGNYYLDGNIRFDETYPFYNIFLQSNISNSEDSILFNKQLELNFFDPKTGKKINNIGKSMGESSIRIFDDLILEKGKSYKVELGQNMRLDTIPGIVSVNLSLHKKEE
ncbi:MAG: hypothetical protein RIR51_2048 [Bacteroidota bacterium]|jgi:gliding motility-associated lipoprotein GldH